MATSKLTIDLTEKNRETLDKIKTDQRSSYGTTINELIEVFFNTPESVKKELVEFIIQKLKQLYKQMDTTDDFNFKEISEKTQAYINIAALFNNRKSLSANEIDSAVTLRKIPMKNGFLICPEEWIIVNPEEAKDSEYACVLECRNSSKYGIPHFLIFSNCETVKSYSQLYEESIYRKCCSAYPKFSEILEMQVTPIDDPDNPGLILNTDEWIGAPNIGLFDVYIQDDPKYGIKYNPPFGARIVITNTNN